MIHSPKFSPVRLGFTAFASLTVFTACSMDRRPDSTANGRIQKAKCSSPLRFSVDAVNNGRRAALNANPHAKVRTVFESDSAMVHASAGKLPFQEETVSENTSNSSYQINVPEATLNCQTLTAVVISPTVPGGQVEAEIKDIDVHKIELAYDVGGVVTTLKIEMELPENAQPRTKTQTVRTLTASGVNKLVLTQNQVGPQSGEVKVISDSKALASDMDTYKVAEAAVAAASSKLSNTNPGSAGSGKIQPGANASVLTVADLKTLFPASANRHDIPFASARTSSSQEANASENSAVEGANEEESNEDDEQPELNNEVSEEQAAPAPSADTLREAIIQQVTANNEAIAAAEGEGEQAEATDAAPAQEAAPAAAPAPAQQAQAAQAAPAAASAQPTGTTASAPASAIGNSASAPVAAKATAAEESQNRIVAEDPEVQQVVAEETAAEQNAEENQSQAAQAEEAAPQAAAPQAAAPQAEAPAQEETEAAAAAQQEAPASAEEVVSANSEAIQSAVAQTPEEDESEEEASPTGETASAPAPATAS